ncbi:MAG: glycosyltransferase [Caldilineaceae bacterium]|nr:glycosyltransferase [Caldilineaceae bacterium]
MSRRALVITHTHPLPDLDGGSRRVLCLMQMLHELGWEVTNLSAGRAFHPAYDARAHEAQALLAAHGIEAAGPAAPLDYLAAHGAELDLILLAVVPGPSDFVAQLRRAAPHATLIFDTIELTFVSMMRAASLRRSARLAQQARTVQASQLALATAADFTLVVTPEEAALLARLCPEARVRIISNVHEVMPGPFTPEGRRDLLFVGNYVHMPNRDAAQHFVADIWPRVRAQLPAAVVRFVGLPVPEVTALAAPDVLVTGHVSDLAPLYAASRVAIAPLRFGAGVKGKVLEAMGYGLPVVMTPVAAEGTFALDGEHARIAATPAVFVDAVVELARDNDRWLRLSQEGRLLVDEHFSYAAVKTRLAALLAEIS